MQQPGRVGIDGPHPVRREQLREDPRHCPPVLHDVADAGRGSQIVLQHPELAGLVPHQVDTADVDPHTIGRRHAVRRAAVRRAAHNDPAGYDAVAEHLLRAVHVGEEGLQGPDPLDDAAFDHVPLLRGDQARDQVQRKRSLLTRDVEGDPLVAEGICQGVGAAVEVFR